MKDDKWEYDSDMEMVFDDSGRRVVDVCANTLDEPMRTNDEVDEIGRIVSHAQKFLIALEKIRDINEGDLVKYCQKVDAIACEVLAQYEASA